MRRRKLSVRVGAIILSAAMLVTSVTPAMAASENAADSFVPVVEETVAEEPAAEETVAEEPATEETVDQAGAYNGTPSKVIGVEVHENYNTYSMGYEQSKPYVSKNISQSVLFFGTKDDLKALEVFGGSCYLYDGVYYAYGWVSSAGYVELYNPVTLVEGKSSDYYDSASGYYVMNGAYYTYLPQYTSEGKTYIGVSSSNEVLPIGKFESYDQAREACGVKDVNGNYAYYTLNGRFFTSVDYTYTNGQKKFFLSNEITFDATRPYVSWNDLSSDEVQVIDGEQLLIGYEVEIDGKMCQGNRVATYADGTKTAIRTSSSFYPNMVLSAGQSMTARVRGVYYYGVEVEKTDADGEKYTTTEYFVSKVGEWSDAVTYTFNGYKTAAGVSGLTAYVYDNDSVQLDWNQVVEANSYSVLTIDSKKPIDGLTRENFCQFYSGYGDAYEASGLTYADYDTDCYYSSATQCKVSYSKDYPYHYYVVCVNGVAEGYVNPRTYSNLVGMVTSTEAYAPQVQNLRVENLNDGTFNIAFDPISDADVYVYAYELNQFPALYNYNLLDLRAVTGSYTYPTGETYYYTTDLDLYDLTDAERIAINKVQRVEVSGSEGYVSSSEFNLKTGVKYYFVAHTYDSVNSDVDRAAYVTIDNVAYTRYNDVSPVSNMVSGKLTLSKPSVSTASNTKTSIKLTMSGSNATGFEIYKKSGKKYKKIATTTDKYYVDENLKENTKYSYKVRSYYYNKDSKVKCYSDYTYVTAETSSVTNIALTLKKKSKTSVTLSWNKVSGATKYEIYRSNMANCDPSIISKKFYDCCDYAEYLCNQKFQLVKTLSAKKKSYTDKKLTAGDDYTYIVVAYYKNAKKTEYISDSNSVSLELEVPQNVQTTLKKNSAKVTWEKDAYASKYELKYTIYDAEGVATTKAPVKASTKKATYTIKNIPNGGYASVSVRAYGKNKKYSSWTSATTTTSLGATSKIKATNVVVNEKAAVKVTWKGVSGAKYYKVFRSTKDAVYNKDEKKYIASGSYIAKEGNDDENYDTVIYDDYYGVEGSVVGTVAYDYAVLDEGVQYYYYVVAYGEKGTEIASYVTSTDSKWSLASGKPASVVYKASIAATLKNSKKGQVKVTYNKVAGAKKYVIYRADKKNGKYKQIGSTKKTTYTDKKAKKGKTYYYKVVATGTNAVKADLKVTSAVKKIKVKK